MTYRVNYEVKGVLAFLSHLEIMRLWQRAILRSGLAVAWTKGFNPRPKLSLGPARGVGIEGLSEYFDVDFQENVKAEVLLDKLNTILPEGVAILKVREIFPGTKMLEAVINEALYLVKFLNGMPPDAAEQSADFMAKDQLLITRESPKGAKQIDLRAFVNNIQLKGDDMYLSVRTGTTGSIRVAELLTAFGYWDIMKDIKIQRLGLFVTEGTKRDTP